MLNPLFLRSLPWLVALLCSAPALAGDALKDLFAKTAAAYGGKPPAARIERGTTTSFRRGAGALLRLYKAPDRFMIRIEYAGGAETRNLVGAAAWQQGVLANPVLRGAIALQTARIALPWNMLARPDAAVDLGTGVTPDGKPMHAVEFALDKGLKLIVEIDQDSGRMVRSRGILSLGGGTMEFATLYADFRHSGGRLHAAREEHFAMGRHTGFSTIERVEYPETIADSEFMP